MPWALHGESYWCTGQDPLMQLSSVPGRETFESDSVNGSYPIGICQNDSGKSTPVKMRLKQK